MPTRADIEQEMIARAAAQLIAVGMDGSTVDGSNLSLNAPIGWAIRQAGGSVAAPSLVTDTDVATVTDYDLLLDLAELRTLQSVLGGFTAVDLKAGPVEIKGSQTASLIERRIAQLQSWLGQAYGIGGYGAFSVSLTRIDGYSEWAALE